MNIVKQTFADFVKHQKCVTPLEYALEILPKCSESGPWIAGGSLLRTYTGQPLDSDIDVFFQNKEQCDKYIFDLSAKSYKGLAEERKSSDYQVKGMFVNQWHNTLTINYMEREWKIQCVTFIYFNNIVELFSSFDFDVCMWAYDGQNVHSYESTVNSIKNKTMNLKKINYPSVTLKRLVKYMRQGYNISDTDVMNLAMSFRSIKKEPKDIMEEHFPSAKVAKSDDYEALSKNNTASTASTPLSSSLVSLF